MRNNHEDFSKTLVSVLTEALGETITEASYSAASLHGGTLGDVRLISGTAKTAKGGALPFKLVHKIQKKWERRFDVHSWRREYDLYNSGMDSLFSESLRWPKCYHSQMEADEIQIWMEYIEGETGLSLNIEMFESAAEELGKFQGRLYAQKPELLEQIGNLSAVRFIKDNYLSYRSWDELSQYIRAESCDIPEHLCKMLIDIDEQAERIWEKIEGLPIVLCHRDFWVTNIFYTEEGIRLIDWDTTGWGYLGEDIASLIADEAPVSNMLEYYKKCVPAYYRGFSQYVNISHIHENCIWEMAVLVFGYRLVEWYKFAKTAEEKQLQLDTLQKIYEMKML